MSISARFLYTPRSITYANRYMNVTKYRHACVSIQTGISKLVIDPGIFSTDFTPTADITAVVVTHAHPDHCKAELLAQIQQISPEVKFFSAEEVAHANPEIPFTIVTPGQTLAAGDLQMTFYGGEHATIHPNIAPIQNIGVMVNDSFYYPGDSFVEPHKPVKLLALPVSAPWLKISEVMDFVAAIKPASCFPTHNAILSPEGQGIVDNLIGQACQQNGVMYTPLQPGQSTQL